MQYPEPVQSISNLHKLLVFLQGKFWSYTSQYSSIFAFTDLKFKILKTYISVPLCFYPSRTSFTFHIEGGSKTSSPKKASCRWFDANTDLCQLISNAVSQLCVSCIEIEGPNFKTFSF